MHTPTWSKIAKAITDGADDVYALADALGCDAPDLTEPLAEMTDKALLYRYVDKHGVTRYGVPGERRAA